MCKTDIKVSQTTYALFKLMHRPANSYNAYINFIVIIIILQFFTWLNKQALMPRPWI